MTAGGVRGGVREAPTAAAADSRRLSAGTLRAGLRLVRLYAVSRRVPAAATAIAACAIALRIALMWHWDTYGALQVPLVFEAASAAAITVTSSSVFGEVERAAGQWLPLLRLATTLALTMAAASALAGAGIGAHLPGGTLDVLRNVAGMTGIGLVCATAVGGGLAWAGPAGYLLLGVYGLYTQWHGPALTTPWIWPARSPRDLGAAICAALAFILGMAVITLRGARDQ
jgi:hypothetical protein